MSKKVLSLVLALVMVLGSFSFVSAAAYDDVTGTAYADAVDRLSLLGILEGYPDGTFKPEGQITRAEFAAVAIRAKGLANAAAAAQGLPTGFTDVPGTFWASGVVGTAARLGIVNGVGNGLFAPQSPVKYEDAITMLVRALGYEESAKAKGGYPYGYLIVANEIGLLDEVKGTQGAPATRGIVAQMTDNALEIEMMVQVGYGTETKWVVSGTEGTDEKYLLDELGFESVKGRVVSVNTKTDKLVVDPTDEDLKNVTLEVAEGFDFYEVEGLETKFWYKDDVVVLYVVKEEAKFDAVEVDDDEITLITEDENYEVARNATLTVDGKDVKQDKFEADYAKVVLNDDDEIIWAQGYTFDGFILVEEVEDLVALSYDDYDEVDLEDFTIVKEGKTITAEEIEEQDILFFNNDEEFAVVANKGTEGELDKVYTDGTFRFEGAAYAQTSIGNAVALYFDEGKIGELDADILDEFLDDEATIEVFVDFAGDVVLVKGEVSSVGNSSYAALTDDVVVYSGRKGNMIALDVRNGANEKVSYDLLVADLGDDIELTNITAAKLQALKKADNYVLEISTDKDGDVTAIELPESVELKEDFDFDDANAKGKDGFSYKLQSSTIVFHDSNKKATTLGNAKDEFSEVKAGARIYFEKGRVVAVIGETDADTDTKDVTGLVTGVKSNSSGKLQFTVKVLGETQRLDTESKTLKEADYKNLVDKIVTFNVGETSGEIKDKKDSIKVVEGKQLTITRVSGRTISSKEFTDVELNSKAVIYDAADDFETLNLRDLKKDMVVTVYFQGSSRTFVDYVVVGAAEETDTEVAGLVTKVGANYYIIDSKATYFTDSKTTVTDKDGVILFIGGADVQPSGYEGDPAGILVGDQVEVIAKDGVATTIKRLSTLLERNALKALNEAKKLAATKVEADYEPLTWKALTNALALPEKTYLQIVDKESAIDAALSALAGNMSEAAKLTAAKKAVEALEDEIDNVEEALDADLTKAVARGALEDALDAANDAVTGVQDKITAVVKATDKEALQARFDAAVEAIEVATDIYDIFDSGIANITEKFDTDRATTIAAVEAAVEADLAGLNSTVEATWTDAPATIDAAGVAAADYVFKVELENGTVEKTITVKVNVTITAE